MLSILWKLNYLMNLHIFHIASFILDCFINNFWFIFYRIKFFFFFTILERIDFFWKLFAPPCTKSIIGGKKSDAGISSIIYLILGMFNILSYHKLLTYNISNFTSIKYLSQQLRSSYNVHVLGSKSYRKLIINYVIAY